MSSNNENLPTVRSQKTSGRFRATCRQWINDIRQAIGGTQHDFTQGSIGRGIFLLAVPMVLELVLESVFAVVDIFYVSRLGPEAVAAVGLTECMLTIVYALACGFATATTALIARRTGEKQLSQAARTAGQALWLAILVAQPFMWLGFLMPGTLLSWMGADSPVVEIGSSYTALIIGGNLIIVLLFVINAIFRGVGDAVASMRVLWLANAINLILDPCLIFGLGPFPELGVTGAAVATCIGRGVGVSFQIYLLTRRNRRLRLNWSDLKPIPEIMKKLCRVAAGGVGQLIIATSSWIFMARILATFGSEVLAGYTIAIRIIIFSILPSWGLSNAAATLVGQNLGADQPERAVRSVWTTGFINMAFMGGIALAYLAAPRMLMEVFTAEPGVIESGIQCLRIVSCGYLLYALGMVMISALNGAGDTRTPTWINLLCFWVLEIPLAYWLAIPGQQGITGVYVAILMAESMVGLLSTLMFQKGRWRNTSV